MASPSSSRKTSGPVLRSTSPAARFASASTAAASFASSFASPHDHPQSHHHRSVSPTRVNIVGGSRSVRSHVISRLISSSAVPRRSCSCSPTTHPGSFRCSLHKGFQSDRSGRRHRVESSPSNRFHMRRSAMTNSIVRIGTVEGDLVKRALAALIRPSSHQQRRRAGFQPGPSRLSIVSTAGDL